MNKYIFFVLFTIMGSYASYEDFSAEKSKLKEDSITFEYMFWRLKSDFARDKLSNLMEQLNIEKKLFTDYKINFFYSKDYYGKDYENLVEKRMPVDALLDSLEGIISSGSILRVTKNKLNKNSGTINLIEDRFYDLNEKIEYRDSDFLKKILLETVTNSSVKTSLEWIWGRSYEGDAYFSSKLTSFDDIFTIYPVYRTYVGVNSFREDEEWFENLKNYDSSMLRGIYDQIKMGNNRRRRGLSSNIGLEDYKKRLKEYRELLNNSFKGDEVTNKSLKNILSSDIEISFVEYIKNFEGVYKSGSKIKENLSLFLLDILSNGTVGIEVSNDNGRKYFDINSSEKSLFFDLREDIRFKEIMDMIKFNLDNNLTRYSYKFITHRDKNRYFYTLVTVYDKMVTVFYNYEKRVSRKVKKDVDSYFNSLPYKL
ncbi:MAG: hypothetical protein CR982_09750 [Candidatus Cloacimonadota bacterium]|nr:MAG: hypothetical protein CR982_09750 [Candidatus Cloacimonadota bacterium]PIE78189.1 MAG: hypothetical protein CSA15_09065 [Candidatus Delongbacteria bacterium]